MRRTSLLAVGIAVLAIAPAVKVYAQASQAQDDQRRQAEAEDDAKKKKKEKEWKLDQAPLPVMKNAGPCPYVKVLYDAGRYVELKHDEEASGAVGYTGEIEQIRSTCAYRGAEPIHVSMAVDFNFGRGPQAEGLTKDFRYWVAVTVRNEAIIDKQYFTVPAQFRPGEDRAAYVDHLQDIVIPRAKPSVSGGNFEILVGFDVTPQMAEFNRMGKRFRVNAGVASAETASNDAAKPGLSAAR